MTPSVSATPASVAPGQNVLLTGSGFPASVPLTAQLFSDPVLLGTSATDAAGTFRFTVTVPLGTAPGVHTIRVTAAGTAILAETSVVVTAPVTVASVVGIVTTLLSRTGSNVAGPARAALALVVAGFVLLGCAWRSESVPAGFGRPVSWPARRRRRRW